jgi:hypothetical protein
MVQNLMHTMLYAYRLQRLMDNDDDEDETTQEKLAGVWGMFTYLYQGSQAFSSS